MNYIGTAIYKNDTLQSISTPVGRTDMSKSVPQEQYFVKDHLGNVRSVVSDAIGSGGIGTMAAQSKTYNATYETGNLNQEEQTFDQVAVLSEDKPESTSSSDSKAALLTTDNTSTPNVGTTLLLKVMAGDKLSLNADNYYESSESNSSTVSGSSFEQVVNSLAQAAGQLSGTEGTIASDWAAQMLNSSSLQQAYDALQNSATDPEKPRAYLNYLFFDEQMQLLPAYSRIWQADGAGNWSRIGTDANETMDVPQNRYVASYISTQSAEPTYFDNLAVTLQPGILLEEKHYYPYGLPIVGMGSTSAGMLPNKNRYQGNEYREDLGLNWMDFHNRQYDPQLGRFLSLDPMADAAGQQTMSPYHAMACNPSTMVDPLGLAPQYLMGLNMANPLPGPQGAMVEGNFVSFGGSMMGGGVSDIMKSIKGALDEASRKRMIKALWNSLIITNGDISNAQAKTLIEAIQSGEAMIKGGNLIFYHNIAGETKMVSDPNAGMPEGMLTYDSDVANVREEITLTPWEIGWEWLTGKGERHHDFQNGDYFTEQLRKHEHIQEARAKIPSLIAQGDRFGSIPYGLGGIQGVGKYIKDYSTLLTGGTTGNIAVTYLGSYDLKWSVQSINGDFAIVKLNVENSSTMQSASRPPLIGYTPVWQKTIGKAINSYFSSGWGSKTTQSFNWVDTIKLK